MTSSYRELLGCKMGYISEDVLTAASQMIQGGATRSEVVKFIAENSRYTEKHSYAIVSRLVKHIEENGMMPSTIQDPGQAVPSEPGMEVLTEPISKRLANELEFTGDYVYNPEERKYVFLLQGHAAVGKNIVLPYDTVKGLFDNYSNYDGSPKTINELSVRYKIPRHYLIHILKALGITHDSLPLTEQDYIERSEDDMVDELVANKKFGVSQKFHTRQWKETQERARKYDALEIGLFDPFEQALKDFKPKKNRVTRPPANKKTGQYWFLIGLSDLHFGLQALGEQAYHNAGDYDIEIVRSILDDYLQQVLTLIDSQKLPPTGLILALFGDLLHSLTGFTEKGTNVGGFPQGAPPTRS